jgi:hypothetical protein
MELNFNDCWGCPPSLTTTMISLLLGLLILTGAMFVRRAKNMRVSGAAPLMLIVAVGWYLFETIFLLRTGVQWGPNRFVSNPSISRVLLVVWYLASGIVVYLVLRRQRAAPPEPAT